MDAFVAIQVFWSFRQERLIRLANNIVVSTDPISRASAELLAAGVTGRERLLVLQVLGALIDEAGPWGMVQPDPEGIAATLATDPDVVTRRIAILDHVGAIAPCGDRWQVVGAPTRPHHGPSVATAMAILAGEAPASRRADQVRRLAPVTAAVALVAVLVGTLTVITSSTEPDAVDRLVAVDAPSTSLRSPGSSADRSAAPVQNAPGGTDFAATPDGIAPPAATPTPTPPSGSAVVASTIEEGCVDSVLEATVRRLDHDLSEEGSEQTIAVGWTENTEREAVLLHTVVIEGHELVLPTAVPVSAEGFGAWAIVLDDALVEEIAGADPADIDAIGRATALSCLAG